MTGYNAVNDTTIDDLSLGLCDICNVRLTVGCEHSQRIEYQEWLGVYLAAEEMAHPVDVAQRLEREIDAILDPRTPEQIALDEWQAESALTRESDRPENW